MIDRLLGDDCLELFGLERPRVRRKVDIVIRLRDVAVQPSRNFPTTSPEMQFDQFGFVYATIVPQPSVPAPKIEPQIYGSARIVPVRCGPPCGMMAGGPS